MADLVTVLYSESGAIAALDITDPQQDGRIVGAVERGKTVDVPKNVADDLLAREDFSLPAKPKAVEKGNN